MVRTASVTSLSVFALFGAVFFLVLFAPFSLAELMHVGDVKTLSTPAGTFTYRLADYNAQSISFEVSGASGILCSAHAPSCSYSVQSKTAENSALEKSTDVQVSYQSRTDSGVSASFQVDFSVSGRLTPLAGPTAVPADVPASVPKPAAPSMPQPVAFECGLWGGPAPLDCAGRDLTTQYEPPAVQQGVQTVCQKEIAGSANCPACPPGYSTGPCKSSGQWGFSKTQVCYRKTACGQTSSCDSGQTPISTTSCTLSTSPGRSRQCCFIYPVKARFPPYVVVQTFSGNGSFPQYLKYHVGDSICSSGALCVLKAVGVDDGYAHVLTLTPYGINSTSGVFGPVGSFDVKELPAFQLGSYDANSALKAPVVVRFNLTTPNHSLSFQQTIGRINVNLLMGQSSQGQGLLSNVLDGGYFSPLSEPGAYHLVATSSDPDLSVLDAYFTVQPSILSRKIPLDSAGGYDLKTRMQSAGGIFSGSYLKQNQSAAWLSVYVNEYGSSADVSDRIDREKKYARNLSVLNSGNQSVWLDSWLGGYSVFWPSGNGSFVKISSSGPYFFGADERAFFDAYLGVYPSGITGVTLGPTPTPVVPSGLALSISSALAKAGGIGTKSITIAPGQDVELGATYSGPFNSGTYENCTLTSTNGLNHGYWPTSNFVGWGNYDNPINTTSYTLSCSSAQGNISDTVTANVKSPVTPGPTPTPAYVMKSYIEGFLDAHNPDNRTNDLVGATTILNGLSPFASGGRMISAADTSLVFKGTVFGNGDSHAEEEHYYLYAKPQYDSDSKSVKAKNPQIAYDVVFDTPIQICPTRTPMDANGLCYRNDGLVREVVRFLGQTWVINGYSGFGMDGSVGPTTQIVLDKEINPGPKVPTMKVGDEIAVPNGGVHVRLESVSKSGQGAFGIYDANGQRIDTASLAAYQSYKKNGIILTVFLTGYAGIKDPVASDWSFGVTLSTDELTLQQSSTVSTDNSNWRVNLVGGGQAFGASLSRIQLVRSVNPDLNAGDSIPFLDKPKQMAFSYQGLEQVPTDTLRLSTGISSFPTSATDTTTTGLSYVLVQSSLTAPFDFSDSPVAPTKTNQFYVIIGGTAGAGKPGMVFYRDPTTSNFVPYTAKKSTYDGGKLLQNFVKYVYGSNSVDIQAEVTDIMNFVGFTEYTTDQDDLNDTGFIGFSIANTSTGGMFGTTDYTETGQQGYVPPVQPGFITPRGSQITAVSAQSATVQYATRLSHAQFMLSAVPAVPLPSPSPVPVIVYCKRKVAGTCAAAAWSGAAIACKTNCPSGYSPGPLHSHADSCMPDAANSYPYCGTTGVCLSNAVYSAVGQCNGNDVQVISS